MNRIAYILQAKTQYSLHSPFVFGLYNDVLVRKTDSRQLKTSTLSRSERRNASIVYKLADHFCIKHLFINGYEPNNPLRKWLCNELPQLTSAQAIDNENIAEVKPSSSIITCTISSYKHSKNALQHHISSDTIIVVTGIHKHKQSENQWAELQNDTSNILTIDLFSCGLVFFRHELSVERYVLLV